MAGASRSSSPSVTVGLLGPVRATVGDRSVDVGGGRQRALLAALAVDAGRTVSTDALIDAVWDGEPPDAAERTFRTYVARLRRAFDEAGADGTGVVVTAAAGYRLDGTLVITDAAVFEEEIAVARARLSAGEAAAAAEQLSTALDRWEGRALGEFADRPWAAPTSTRLEEARQAARELRVRALLDAGRTGQAVTRSEQLAAAEPLRESVARLRALALYRAGRDADALQGLRGFRTRLVEEHGLDPSPRLAELETMILERDPRLDRSVGGRRLRGYVLHEPIAHSPLGTVHRAEQPSIGREVAVTVLPPAVADDAEVVRAFETRVQAVAGLDHPHVLPVYDYWREPGGAYVVTRFPSGGTLAQRLRGGGLDATRALVLGEQVADALAAAHEAGVVHGGLDADAVVVDERGDAFVWAFPVTADAHPRDDVAALAALITRATTGEGAVATAVLPEPAATALAQAGDPSGDTGTTAASLAAAFEAARLGEQRPPTVPAEAGPNPYRGLAAFREVDSHVFFGRDALVEQVRARLARFRAVAVIGPSGAGKSSAVRAGVLPVLRGEGDFVTAMLPGTRPLAELEVALARVAAQELDGVADEVAATPEALRHVIDRVLPDPRGDLVLVVDQFEELFTLSAATERDLFLAALRDVVEDPNARAKVLVTLRADFLGQVLSHPVAGPLVRDRSVMVGPLTDDELHEAVTRPAEVAGVAVEPALATAVVADAARFPGSLPMVQFALTEVFEAAEDGTMTLAAYRRIGGIEGVLGQRAEEVFQRLDDVGQRAAATMFQRLVVPHDDGPPARRRALRTEFDHVPDEVIDAFGRARLLRFDHDEESREPTVEVTHEALFRAWPRLVAWIEEGEDDLRLLGHLTVSAGEWDDGGRREADLYRGHRLDAALAFAADRRAELSETERTYLDASMARRARDAAADRRSVRRLRMLTGGLAVGLVLALVAGTLALTGQPREVDLRRAAEAAQAGAEAAAEREAATAEAAQADALAFASGVLVDQDLRLSMLLATEAYAIQPDVDSETAILRTLSEEPRVRRLLSPPSGGVCGTQPPLADVLLTQVDAEDERSYAVVTDFAVRELGRVRLPAGADCPSVDRAAAHVYAPVPRTGELQSIDLETGAVVASRGDWGGAFRFSALDHSPSRPEALLRTNDGRLLRVATPDLTTIAEVPVPDGVEVAEATYSETGDSVVFATRSGVAVHVIGRGVLESDLVAGPSDNVYAAHLSEQAGVVFATVDPNTLLVAPLAGLTGFEPVQLPGDYTGSAVVHPDGDRVAVTTTEGVQVLSLPSLEPLGEAIALPTSIGTMTWGPRGELFLNGPAGVVTMDTDRAFGVGEVISEVTDVGFALFPAPDGRSALRFAPGEEGPNSVVREWVDLTTGASTVLATPEQDFTVVQALLPGKRAVRVDLAAGTIEAWQDGSRVSSVELPAEVPRTLERRFSIMRVGHGLAAVVLPNPVDDAIDGVDQWVLVIDVETATPLSSFELPAVVDGEVQLAVEEVRPVGPDRLMLVTRAAASIVGLDGERLVGPAMVVQGGENSASSPDGSRIALAGFSGEIVITDQDLRVVATLTGGTANAATSVEFVSGDRLVSRHTDGVTQVWDIDAGRPVGTLFNSTAELPYGFNTSVEGLSIVQATSVGVVRIPLEPSEWLTAVCDRVDRPLDSAELRAFAPGRTPIDPCGSRGGTS